MSYSWWLMNTIMITIKTNKELEMKIDYYKKENPIVQSNPKSVEDYLSMFNIFRNMLKEIDEFMIELKKNEEKDSYNFYLDQARFIISKAFNVNHTEDIGGLFDLENGEFGVAEFNSVKPFDYQLKKNIVNYIDLLKKNDRVDSVLKWYRAVISYALYHYYFSTPAFELDSKRNKFYGHISNLLNSNLHKLKKHIDEYEKLSEKKELYEVIEALATEKLEPDEYEEDSYLNGEFELDKFNEEILTQFHANLTGEDTGNIRFSYVVKSILGHFLDLYNSNNNRYSQINKITWSGKSPAEIIAMFKIIELGNALSSNVIEYTGKNEKEYNELWEDAFKITKEYLKINDNLAWYLVNTNSSEFEAFIGTQGSGSGSHCGRDPDADVLFSLRETNKNGQFILHGTVACKRYMVGNKCSVERLRGEYVYEPIQLKYRRNQAIPPQFWKAMMDLFETENFVYQDDLKDGYGSSNDFNIFWLIGFQDSGEEKLKHKFILNDHDKTYFKKRFNDFLKLKPYWKNFEGVRKFFDIMSSYMIDFIKDMNSSSDRGSISKDMVMNDDVMTFYYTGLSSLIEDWENFTSDYDSRRRGYCFWSNLLDLWNDPSETILSSDLSIYENEDKIEDYLDFMKDSEDYNYIYNSLKNLQEENDYKSIVKMLKNNKDEDPIIDKVYHAMNNAYLSGYEAGTSSEIYKRIINYFDGLAFNCNPSGNRDNYGRDFKVDFVIIREINKTINDKDMTWLIEFDLKVLDEYFSHYETSDLPEFYISKYERERGLEFDWEYDDGVAIERLSDELYEIKE